MTTFLMSQLGNLGQSECGEAPGVGPGESKICCPELGWVVEAAHQERLQDVKLRFVIGQINAVKRSEQARLSSIAAAQAAERARRAKALADAARSKRNTKLFAIGAASLVAAKLFKLF